MKVLLDHNFPRSIARKLREHHQVDHARDLRWDAFQNGRLIKTAELSGYEVMITGDKGILYQQNNAERRIALIRVTRTKRLLLLSRIPELLAAISRANAGTFEEVVIPDAPRAPRNWSIK